MTDLNVRRNVHADGNWKPTPPGSILVAWDTRKESDGVVQSRLYLTTDRRFLEYEQQRDRQAARRDCARARRRVLDRETARELYRRLRVQMVPEPTVFDG